MTKEEQEKLKEYEAKRKAKLEALNEKSKAQQLKVEKLKQEFLEKQSKKKKPEDFQGYYYDLARKKYRVQFRFGGKQYRLGAYPTHWEAHEVYLEERSKLEALAKAESDIYKKEIDERHERIQAELKAKREAEDKVVFPDEYSEGDSNHKGDEPNSDLVPF